MPDIDFQTDKCTENYTIRIPEVTKKHLEKLPSQLKAKLKKKILIAMAEVSHENSFDPGEYLKTSDL